MKYSLSRVSILLSMLWILLVLFSLPIEASDRLTWQSNGHSYQIVEISVTWPEAKTYCESQGGYLATITSKEENDFIFSRLGGSYSLWIGGTDIGHEGTWSWVNNEPWSYSNWDVAEPNNSYGNENSLEIAGNGKWNDNDSDRKFWFSCEWNNENSSGISLVTNGGFEDPGAGITIPPNEYHTYVGGDTFPGWRVESGNVDIQTSKHGKPHSGLYTLDLSGSIPGSVSQTLSTISGEQYTLELWYAAHPYHPYAGPAKALVRWGGSDIGLLSLSNLNQMTHAKFIVTASSNTTILNLVSLSPNGGIIVDDVTVLALNDASSRASNLSISQSGPGRYRLLGTLVDANKQPACGLALASGRCVFTCGPGSLRCEGGASNLPLGQFELTDLPAEANGALNLQTFVFGSLPGLQVVNSGGDGCSHTIDPTSQTFTYEGGTGTVTVSAPSGCAWTAQSNNDWITITAGASGTGPGQVTYTVASHSSSSQRRGTLTIAGQTLTVLQAPKSDDGGGGGGH